jgi:hypothetical protein
MNYPKRIISCPVCGKECKGRTGLSAHTRFVHASPRPPLAVETAPEAVQEGASAPSSPREEIFVSPMSAMLRVVVKPSTQTHMVTPTGILSTRAEGKVAEFRDGVLITKDPEIIDFLENHYRDDRYPVYSKRRMDGLCQQSLKSNGSQQS